MDIIRDFAPSILVISSQSIDMLFNKIGDESSIINTLEKFKTVTPINQGIIIKN